MNFEFDLIGFCKDFLEFELFFGRMLNWIRAFLRGDVSGKSKDTNNY
jgi:hypothetical protein